MSKLKTIIILTAVVCVLFFLVEGILLNFFPSYVFKGHIMIPVFFWLLYVLAIVPLSPGMRVMKLTRYILGFKAVKMFLSMLVVLVGAFVMRSQLVSVVFVFMFYYMIMLVPESLFFMYIKHSKK